MVLNIKLSVRRIADSDDPLARDWYGYDPDATAEELWDNNRGDWPLNESSIDRENWVALNYQGRVVLVAELSDPSHETLETASGKQKKALIGRVLPAGHPIREALIGTQVVYPPRSRNPIWYGPDPVTVVANGQLLDEPGDLPGARGQGLQMNPEIRSAVENAAQDRLMRYFQDRGWTVTDTRLTRPYDAEAVRGTQRRYLEAKGTQSRGESVIVTRNEVDHARMHPGLCVMGVWSGMQLVGGVVDPEAGDFKVLDFNPDDEQLRPRDFDWTLPAAGEETEVGALAASD